MVIRKGRGPSASLEALAFFSLFDDTHTDAGQAVQDGLRTAAVLERMQAGLEESLANEGRLHGWRVQNLFEALMVFLGSIHLIKTEDVGNYYFDDSKGRVKPPDFRIVREDGEHLLVEVKNVKPAIGDKVRISGYHLDQERRYAELTDGRLVLAHYWSGYNTWTVVDSSVVGANDRDLELSFVDALKVNELGLLGDAEIGTRPPLTLSLIADRTKPQSVHEINESGRDIHFTIGAVELTADGKIVREKLEQKLAWFLMLYGRWDQEVVPQVNDTGELERVTYVSKPPAEADDEKSNGISVVGSLSSMYSALYNSLTLTTTGKVHRLRNEPDPTALASLLPPDYWSRSDRNLPIWKLVVRPTPDIL